MRLCYGFTFEKTCDKGGSERVTGPDGVSHFHLWSRLKTYFIGCDDEAAFCSACQYQYVQIVSVNDYAAFILNVNSLDVSQVNIDDNTMSHFMVEALIRRGRKHIVHIAGPDYISNSADRHRGYREALEKFKIAYDRRYVVDGGLSYDDGAKAMERFLSTGLEFDAIFGFTETSALGAKSVLQKLHYRIPEDVALCCMSGTTLCTLVYPTISAVEQPVKQMASEVCRILCLQIEAHDLAPEQVVLRGDMLLRESTD